MSLRKKLDKEFEELEAVGAEGKKGVEDAKKIFKQQEKDQAEKEARQIEQLNNNRRNKYAYNIFLAQMLQKGLANLSFPLNWQTKVAPTEVGVVMEIETDKHRFFRSAFKSTGDGYYDFNAVKMFLVRADNLIDNLPPLKTKGGIIVK
jgi:hypothetical protein